MESNWDIEAAQTELRKRGKVLASKKSARSATEGLLALALSHTHNRAALIELNCETDFVARNDIFQHLVCVFFTFSDFSFYIHFFLHSILMLMLLIIFIF